MMATVTDRRRRLSIRLGLLALSGWLIAAAPAQAAPTGGPHADGRNGRTVAGLTTATPSARAQQGTLAQTTGLNPSDVSTAAVCPPVALGQARCQAQAIVLRATDQMVRPHVRSRASFTQVFPRVARGITPSAASAGGTPPEAGSPAYLQQSYDLSYLSQTGGSTQTVALVDAYDDPDAQSDLATYRATYGLRACTSANGCFRQVNEYGATSPLPSGDSGWEMEISLDLDAVSALCPNCHILLVEAGSTSLSDMDQAEITAAALGATEISNSWSGDSATPISGTYTFAGVAVVAATGDSGYDGPGWDAYPAALPGVTAAGGTTLTLSTSDAPSARGFSESAWAGGGSGCDLREAKPSYQTDTGCTGRSYSDVSADADPSTGLTVYDAGNGGWLLVGGTSLASPLIAAYDAVTGVNGSTPRWAYADSALLNDPQTGSNGACAASIAYICTAGVGYDGPTGAGSISGDVVTGGPGIGGPSLGAGADNTYTQSVTSTSATLTGGVYPNSLATTYSWQYGTSTAYGQQTGATSIGAGSAPVALSTDLTGLQAGTIYHYRLVAENSDGTSYGYDYTLATSTSPPVNTSAPAIAGTARWGQTLSASSGAWSPTGTYTYSWMRSTDGSSSWAAIPGASGPAYTLTTADDGARIQVAVTASNAYGNATATSATVGPVQSTVGPVQSTVGPVQSVPPAATRPPGISGAARLGQVLRTTGGVWSPAGADTFQWRRSGNGGRTWSNIAGATAARYRLVAADLGDRIDVTVTAADASGSARATSAAVGPVTAARKATSARAKSARANPRRGKSVRTTAARAKAAKAKSARAKAARAKAARAKSTSARLVMIAPYRWAM
jgi:hypothetical protein